MDVSLLLNEFSLITCHSRLAAGEHSTDPDQQGTSQTHDVRCRVARQL